MSLKILISTSRITRNSYFDSVKPQKITFYIKREKIYNFVCQARRESYFNISEIIMICRNIKCLVHNLFSYLSA